MSRSLNSTEVEGGIRLRVAEANYKDVGKGRARVDRSVLARLDVAPGEVLEIIGKKRTAAIAWPALPMEQDPEVIRIDGETRKNAGAALNDYVIVRKCDPKPASKVILSPVMANLTVDRELEEFIHSRLLERPLLKGNSVTVSIFGRQLTFTVLRTVPSGIVLVTQNTSIRILSEARAGGRAFITTSYEDIGGLKEEIRKIREMVELPLRHPEIFERLGVEPPKGVLLYGPPGCGKTLLARAVANEADANFFAINGPEIMGKYYGESEARLREIFRKAEAEPPSIIFIDEIDAIAPKRSEVTGEVEKRVVAQLLALMDGLSGRGNVIVIGATNRPEALDPALRRPGRFDREIEIGIPDKQGRYEILQIHTRGVPLADDVDLKLLAEITHGYTGADLAALVREAAMKAIRRYLPQLNLEEDTIPKEVLDKMVVTMEDFMNAYREIVPTALREVEVITPTVRWSDVGGLENVKKELREAVEWPLKYPDRFERFGIKPRKGILLYGPPGCGKTLLAQAVATESEANFIPVKGPELLSKWVGESEKAVRQVFRRARMAAPSIIFFDEIEALAPKRGMYGGDSGVTDRVISQLLTEMDGIARLSDVIIIAATNRPDLVDDALLRPGRIDLMVYVPPPDLEARKEILRIYTGKTPLASDVNLDEIAARTEGYSGADLEALVREAAMNALRRDINARHVTKEDFEKALSRVQPSISEEMRKWYESFATRKLRGIIQTPIA